MRYALGIDGGGSKCDAVLLDETGAVVGTGRGGPIHTYYDPPEVIANSFRDAIRTALHGVSHAQLWVAGQVPAMEVLQQIVAGVGEVAARIPAREEDTIFAAAHESWGVVALAGTGSFVHGRTQEGKDLHFGGAGPILGDYGSAYAIGQYALRAAFAAHWTEARHTSLVAALPPVLEVADLHAVFRLIYIEQINRRRIAALARTVDAEAERGDRVAQQCLTQAADEFADTVVDLIRELQLETLAFPVIPMGGVARHSHVWWERVESRIHDVAPQAYTVHSKATPAAGAALLALREMGVAWSAEVLARVEESSIHTDG